MNRSLQFIAFGRLNRMCKPFAFALLCAIALSSGLASAADTPHESRLIDCDIGKVALFDSTESEDGWFAIGWTIRVLNKDAKPVDWSLWTHDDHTGGMRDNYIYNFKNDPNFPYELVNCVVDLRRKKILELLSDDPFNPGRPRGSLNAFWSSDARTLRYGLAQNQRRFATENLWLIKINHSGMSAIDLVKPLTRAVHKLLQEKMPLNPDQYAISFPRSDWDDEASSPAFHAASVEIPFTADLPKSGFNKVTGTVTVELSKGDVLKIASETRPDNPFRDDTRLANADRKLNAIYAILFKRLDPASRTVLKNEQIAWIAKRDSDAGVRDYPIVGDEQDPSVVRRNRNESLLKSTLQRIEVLKKGRN